MFRRRRRGLTVLPRYGAPWPSGNQQQHNQNQGPYAAYPMANQYPQQSWGGYQPPSGPPPQSDPAPPPPYPGKSQGYDGEENSGYGYSNAPQQGAPKPGGFVAPGTPSSPPPAHVNTNVRPFLHVSTPAELIPLRSVPMVPQWLNCTA